MNTPQDNTQRQNAQGRTTGSTGSTGSSKSTSDHAEELAEKARSEGQAQAQHYRNVAADKVDTLADSVKAAADELKDDDVAHLSRHISDMAGGLGRLSDGLREKSADEILRDVRRVARENPTLFIAGSIALGFGITRFARASAPSTPSGRTHDDQKTGTETSSARHREWTDSASAVSGTTARPATGNRTIDDASATGATGTTPAIPGPAASTAEAIAARTSDTSTSDTTISGRDSPAPTDTPSGRTQP